MFPRALIRFRRFGRTIEKRAFSSQRRYHWSNPEFENGVSLVHVKKTLKSAGINHIDGHACITIDCPVCVSDHVPDTKCKEHPRAFINKTTGFFVCDTCHHMGPWNIFEKFFVPKKTSKILKELAALKDSLPLKVSFQSQWEEIMKGCRVVSELAKEEYDKMIECLELTRVPQESLSSLNCAYDASAKTIHLPLIDSSNMISGYKSVTASSEATTPPSQAAGLIIYRQRSNKSGSNAPFTATTGSVVIVPSVHDLLALVSQKATQQIICLPHELKNLPQQVLPSLESYKKLTLWFGNDAPSWDTARNFAKKLDEKRCMFVRPTEKQPSPRIAVQSGLDLKNILQSAQPVWHKSITTFHSLRQDVLSDLQNIDRVQGVKWKRYPALNRILKGHRKGEFTILTGPTGSGKTTFMSEYSLDLAMLGVNTLWGSFEIRNARLARTMLTQMAGIPLDVNLETFDAHADAFEKLPIYFMTFHGQQTIKVVMEAVEHATYVHDIAHVIIDNVQFMMGMAEESKHMDRFWKQDAIIGAFRTFATKFNCHVTLVIHPRKEREADDLTTASIFGGAKASQEADNILIIQDKRLTSLRGKKYLQVAKNRYSGDLGVMMLEFDKASLSYAPKRKSKGDDDSPVPDPEPDPEPATNQAR